jgi:nucleotide-binding universal stress UspA family protein
MLPMKTILVPTDFSGSSADALEMAVSLARDRQARLILLHVMAEPVFLEGAGVIPFDPAMYRDEQLDKLERQAVHHPGVSIEKQLAQGKAAAEILRVAQESAADLIVMGTLGATGLRKLLLGSVAEGVARKATCPVLTIRSPLPVETPGPQPAARKAAP